MFMIARLYPSNGPARAAADALLDAGYRPEDVALLSAPTPAGDAAEGAIAPAGIDMATAVRAGKMLGEHADFYLSRLTDGRALVVTTPPIFDSRRAEEILDANGPLADSHLPPKKPFVPLSEQATPFSNMLGMPVLTDSGTPFSDLLGFGFKEEGLSHISRWLKPLAPGFTFSSLIGMSTKATKETVFPGATRSSRLEGKNASFGLKFKTRSDTPFSSMLGLPLLSKRDHFLHS